MEKRGPNESVCCVVGVMWEYNIYPALKCKVSLTISSMPYMLYLSVSGTVQD